ncbi:MAG: hypothetical protein ABW094_02630 [Candidatus Thiodiazotropha sp.]
MEEENKVPIIIGNAAPFRLIVREEDDWEPTLEEINSREYDYVKLHRLSTYLDIGIRPFSLGMAFDGSLVLPATDKFRDKDVALDKFNEVLAHLLFGGIYTEAVSPEDITFGTLTFDGYSRSISSSSGAVAKFHQAIRQKHVGTIDVISLLNPCTLNVEDLESAYKKGRDTLSPIKQLSSGILLSGVTYFVRHQWSESLVTLWTIIEQLVSHIWDTEVINRKDGEITGRKKFLRDYRTWTTSTRVEVLYQNDLISKNEYALLNNARKARNDFVHSGVVPTKDNASACIEVLFKLVSLIISNYADSQSLNGVLESVTGNLRGPLVPEGKVILEEQVSHWLEIPPIPGDVNWGDKEYEVIDSLVLQPVDKSV